jgi:hypothetical protein
MNLIRNRTIHLLLAGLAMCLTAGPAAAQIVTGFEASEGYNGSAAGTPVTGQNGWYTISNDQFIFTYAGNALGFPANSTGGDQFMGAAATANGDFARAIHDVNFSSGGVWTFSYDLCGAASQGRHQTLSSFSLNDFNLARSFIALNLWHKNLPQLGNWKMTYEIFDSTGAGPFVVKPPAAFKGLSQNHWYRQSTTIDFDANQIKQVAITDLSTMMTTTYSPSTWYLRGGSSGGGLSLPTGVRFFVGGGTGSTAGNMMGWDNVSVAPGMAPGVRGARVINLREEPTFLKLRLLDYDD